MTPQGLLIFDSRVDSKGPSQRTCRWHVRRPVAFPQKSESILLHHVSASVISLAETFSKSPLAHSAAAPFPTKPKDGFAGTPFGLAAVNLRRMAASVRKAGLGRNDSVLLSAGGVSARRMLGGAWAWGGMDISASNLLFMIETAVLFRSLRYHAFRRKSRAAANIFFTIFCKYAGKTDRLSGGVARPAAGKPGFTKVLHFSR